MDHWRQWLGVQDPALCCVSWLCVQVPLEPCYCRWVLLFFSSRWNWCFFFLSSEMRRTTSTFWIRTALYQVWNEQNAPEQSNISKMVPLNESDTVSALTSLYTGDFGISAVSPPHRKLMPESRFVPNICTSNHSTPRLVPQPLFSAVSKCSEYHMKDNYWNIWNVEMKWFF